LDRAHLAAFAIFLVLGAIAIYWPRLHELLGWTEWQIAAVCVGLIISFQLIMAPYWAYREAADLVPSDSHIRPNMRIDEALDYIVNDSTAQLKQPATPTIIEYGQAAGRTLIEKGVEHEDARRLLNDELISGTVRCWGRRQITVHLADQFELSLREIDRACWDNIQLNFASCLRLTQTQPQTATIPGRIIKDQWTALMVSRIQIQRIWSRKSVACRLREKMKGHQRIKPLPDFR
jgi:hypothetical protein